MKGFDIGDTYTNRKAARTFVHFIAEAIRREMRQECCKAKFLTVLSDGSTDSSVLEQEIVYCRFAHEGEVLTQFLALQSVKKADAVNIAATIDTVASQTLSKDWKDKLVALGTDGASVMLGRQNGVVAKL